MVEDLEKVELLLEIIITKSEKHQFYWFWRKDIKKMVLHNCIFRHFGNYTHRELDIIQ